GLVRRVGGEIVEDLAAQPVSGANADQVEPVEDVELGQCDAGDARNGAALAHQNGVEPPTAALAPGDGAEFMAALAQFLAGRVVEFGWEGAAADAGRIGLGDAEDEADRRGAEARTAGGGAAD